jgi:hypothetical protein
MVARPRAYTIHSEESSMRLPVLFTALLLCASACASEDAVMVPIPILVEQRGLLTIDGVLRMNSEGTWGASNLVVKPFGGYAAQDYCLTNVVRVQGSITADFASSPKLRMVETTSEVKDAQGRKMMRVSYVLTPSTGGVASYEQVHVMLPLAATDLAGGTATLADGSVVPLPIQFGHEVVVPPGSPSLTLAWGQKQLRVQSEKLQISLLDMRPKTSAFQLRLAYPAPTKVSEMRLAFDIGVETPAFAITADGTSWVELPLAQPAAPGGILDFSALGGPPAGTHGRIIGTDGHFAYQQTGERVRLIGTNLCYTANYLDKPGADRIAAHFRAMGYNTVRFHHTDVHIRKDSWKSQSSDDIDPEYLDRLDYMFAAMKKAGIYVTIDLYTQRRFGKGEIAGIDQAIEGDIKGLVPIHEPAFEAWKKLVVTWMNHINPYTGLAWKDDPALLSICPLNEDSIACAWGSSLAKPLYLARFAAWKREQGLASTVEKPGDDPLFARFLVEVKMASNRKIEAFLRQLGVQALITGSNWWDTMAQTFMRDQFDLVDNHEYSDHPQPHWLPAKYNQQSNLTAHPTYITPIFMASTRVFGKPFTVSEYNYCAPNRFRAEGGALMGAYAALQDWDALYRFAWAHDEKRVNDSQSLYGFDLGSDPLNQLTERQIILLFRRGDVSAAHQRFVYGVTMADATRQGVGDMWSKGLFPHPFNALALRAQTGSQIVEGDRVITGRFDGVVASQPITEAALSGNPYLATTAIPASGTEIVSDTGEITLDRARGTLRVATPRSACIVAPAGLDLAAGGLSIARNDAFCSVSAHAMDDQPLATSGRVLLFHLTDVLNTGMSFASSSMTTLLHWGRLPYVVRTGSVKVSLRSSIPGMRLYACDYAGNRTRTIEATYADGAYVFQAIIAPGQPSMVYELVRE